MLVRVALAVRDSSRFTELQIHLRASGVDWVDIGEGDPAPTLLRDPVDILVVEERAVPSPFERILEVLTGLPDPPLVMLLTMDAGEQRRARLRAGGCEAVLGLDLPMSLLSEAVLSLVRRREEHQTELLQRRRIADEPRLEDFVSRSETMQTFMHLVRRVARTNSSLLIEGETGVGKERLALAIHTESKGGSAPFIAVNCAALPESLLESELFGYEAGAFTGASHTHRGAFELAHGGTIFLDEIGELPLALQGKLLRVLQDRRFQRLGGERPIRVEVRIVAATNRSLADEVAAGGFRRDLYYRLSVVGLTIPPLRERKEDIPELVQSYIDYLGPRVAVDVSSISGEALSALVSYSWPGNVRELINVLERAMLLCESREIGLRDLPEEIATGGGRRQIRRFSDDKETDERFVMTAEWFARTWPEARKEVVQYYERHYLHQLFQRVHGSTARAAEFSGLTARALQANLKRLGLTRRQLLE